MDDVSSFTRISGFRQCAEIILDDSPFVTEEFVRIFRERITFEAENNRVVQFLVEDHRPPFLRSLIKFHRKTKRFRERFLDCVLSWFGKKKIRGIVCFFHSDGEDGQGKWVPLKFFSSHEESVVWAFVKSYHEGVDFQKYWPVDKYYLDLYRDKKLMDIDDR